MGSWGWWWSGAWRMMQATKGQVSASPHMVPEGRQQVWKEEGGVSVKPQGCPALRGEQTDWGVGELESLGLCLLWGSGLAHFLSISVQSWQIFPGTSHLGDVMQCVLNSRKSRGQAPWCQGCA